MNPQTAKTITDLRLLADGCERLHQVVDEGKILALRREAESLKMDTKETSRRVGGGRQVLERCPLLAEMAWGGILHDVACRFLGDRARPVRGLYFDKTPEANWRVPWHQDITLAVRERREIEGFGPWSVKDGIVHVQPPEVILENMVTLRLHLDECPEANGALRVLPGSHRYGRLDAEAIARMRQTGDGIVCEADAGDIIAMRPLTLHASSPASVPGHRRVFHIEYAAQKNPAPLEWFEEAPEGVSDKNGACSLKSEG